jgi:cohesin loading factor subunit SCC2
MDPAAGGGRGRDRAGFERACRLPNTVHSEVLPSLPLPTLPRELANIARVLADTDVSHL